MSPIRRTVLTTKPGDFDHTEKVLAKGLRGHMPCATVRWAEHESVSVLPHIPASDGGLSWQKPTSVSH